MKEIFTLFPFLNCSGICIAQEFDTSDSKWVIDYNGVWSEGITEIQFEKDTSIDNRICKKFLDSVPQINNPFNLIRKIANSAYELSKINLICKSLLSQFYRGTNFIKIGEIAIHTSRNLSNILPSQISLKHKLSEVQKNSLLNLNLNLL
ncbi:MAG: hypothetical protein IPG95_13540 [Saprospiraceae bacterium]|nr:hypothetical protein [Saprospiraceae bacterium]